MEDSLSPGIGRRRFVSLLLSGSAAVAAPGCLSRGDAVEVLYAGSLNRALEEGVGPAFERSGGDRFRGEPRGSVAVVRMVEAGQRSPDVAVSADSRLILDGLVPGYADSCVEFATNSLVMGLRDGVSAEEWFDPLFDDELSVGMSDPDLDPLGYRTAMLLELAEMHRGEARFGEALSGLERYVQETELLAALETGQLDAAVVYRNMAVGHGLEFAEVPARLNLGDPGHAEFYGTASYESSDGSVYRGRPIVYGASVLREAPNWEGGEAFLEFLTRGEGVSVIEDEGFLVPDGFPREVSE